MRNKTLLQSIGVLLWLSLFASFCTDTTTTPVTPPPVITTEVPPSEAPDSLRFCASIAPTKPEPTQKRAVGSVPAYWAQNQVLRVGFLGNPTADQKLFFQSCAGEIDDLVNLTVTYPAAGPYDIRVAFNANSGSWSHIGKNATYVTDQTQPTINIGWGWTNFVVVGNVKQWRDGVVRHEFLHAIGAMHEQCNAKAGICWNTANVYADLAGAPNYWNKATVDNNVLYVCAGTAYQSTTWDSVSVMHYSIPARWRCSGPAIPGNQYLSATDKSFWSAVYKNTVIVNPPVVTTVTVKTVDRDNVLRLQKKVQTDFDSLKNATNKAFGL